MEIVDNTAVRFIVPTDLVPHITDYIERSEVLDTKGNLSEVVVYWGLREMTHLAQTLNFREPLPSPIVKEYSWPGMYKQIGRAHV